MILEQSVKLENGMLLLHWGTTLKNASINTLKQLVERELIEETFRVSH